MTDPFCDSDDLQRRALEGDPTLIKDLLVCYRDDIEHFLQRRCGHEDDAKDATQDAFEAAIHYLNGYRGESSLKNWLYRLASSACLKMRRGRKNDPKLHASIDASPDDGNAISAIAGDTGERLEVQLLPLQEALEQLQDLDRSVLLMRDGEGRSAKETAVALDLTEAAVKSRLFRARKQLRDVLSEGDESSELL